MGRHAFAIEQNVERILALLDQAQMRATFFTLGWVAERYGDLVRRIAASGHEIGSHGYAHHRATEQSPDAFLADITLAKLVLEDTCGKEVIGYRAPSFSIGYQNRWAFDSLAEAGYKYSSSVYPIRHDHYGMPNGPRFPHRPGGGELLELPIATHRVFNSNFPAGGGGYFRLLPYGLSRWLIEQVNRVERTPAIFYFHPWELDPEQPRMQHVRMRARFRHYINLRYTEARLNRLLSDFTWDRLDRVFADKLR